MMERRALYNPANLLTAVFVLSVAGYPVAGILSAALNLPSTSTSIPFRVLVLALSGLLAVASLRGARIGTAGFTLLVLWALYSIRLFWDLGEGIEGITRALQLYIAIVLVPSGASMLAARHWDDQRAAGTLFLLAVLIGVGVLLMQSFGGESNRALIKETGRLSLDTLNPITLGHIGVSGILAALVLIARRPSFVRSATLIVGAATCIAVIAEAGSKSPIVAFGTALILLAFTGHLRPMIVVLAMTGATSLIFFSDTSLAERFTLLGEDESTAIRIQLFNDALNQIVSAPFIGSAYIELESREYPHNIFVEAVMALGIPVGATLGALSLWVGWRILVTRTGNAPFLAAIFCQYLIGAMLSGALFASAAFWVPFAMLCIRLDTKSMENNSRRVMVVDAQSQGFLFSRKGKQS